MGRLRANMPRRLPRAEVPGHRRRNVSATNKAGANRINNDWPGTTAQR
jgi:hypothetical protein